jgi:hypothetical protein
MATNGAAASERLARIRIIDISDDTELVESMRKHFEGINKTGVVPPLIVKQSSFQSHEPKGESR